MFRVSRIATAKVVIPTAILLMAAASTAFAQVPRNGPEYDGKDHQPTQGQVVRKEDRAGIEPSPAQTSDDKRSVQQLDHQLLHEEKVDPPGGSNGPAGSQAGGR